MNIEEWIKQIRKENKLSQSQLGEIISVNQNTISSYETGIRKLDIDKLMILADKLNYSINITKSGINFVKNQEPEVSMCEWCLKVIEDNKPINDNKCPYCGKNGLIKTGKINLNNGLKILKRNKEVVLCENVNAQYTPFSVSILSAYNNGIYSLICGKYYTDLEKAIIGFGERVERYSSDFN